MKVVARVQNPDDIEVEIVTTMTLREWGFVLSGLSTGTVPTSEFAGHLRKVLAVVKQEFKALEG